VICFLRLHQPTPCEMRQSNAVISTKLRTAHPCRRHVVADVDRLAYRHDVPGLTEAAQLKRPLTESCTFGYGDLAP